MRSIIEILSGRRSPEGIKIKRETFSPFGELPPPLALKRVREMKSKSRISGIRKFLGSLHRNQ